MPKECCFYSAQDALWIEIFQDNIVQRDQSMFICIYMKCKVAGQILMDYYFKISIYLLASSGYRVKNCQKTCQQKTFF